MSDMAHRLILPAALAYTKEVAKEAELKKSFSSSLSLAAETALLTKLSDQTAALSAAIDTLDNAIASQDSSLDMLAQATYTRDAILNAMADVRKYADALEVIVAKKFWPMPSYQDILMYV